MFCLTGNRSFPAQDLIEFAFYLNKICNGRKRGIVATLAQYSVIQAAGGIAFSATTKKYVSREHVCNHKQK